jgi:hypothetical protein
VRTSQAPAISAGRPADKAGAAQHEGLHGLQDVGRGQHVTRSLTAPSTTPTITPASSRRRCAARRAPVASVSSTAATAPQRPHRSAQAHQPHQATAWRTWRHAKQAPGPEPPPARRRRHCRARTGRPAGCETAPVPRRRPGPARPRPARRPGCAAANVPHDLAARGSCRALQHAGLKPGAAHAGPSPRCPAAQTPSASAPGCNASSALACRGSIQGARAARWWGMVDSLMAFLVFQALGHQPRGLGHARAGAHQHVGLVAALKHAHALLAQGAHRGQPGRWARPWALRSPIMITSGLARTTYSGLSFGKGPRSA